jgi:hypothetical protein
MKIIILEGGTNTGKTTTMGVVFVAMHMNGGRVNTFTPVQNPSGMDFEADFDYPVNGKMEKVAIYSKGDKIADCNTAISKYSQQNIYTLIIAYSTKKTRLTIPQKDTLVPPVQKTVASPAISEVQANANDGYQIISLI